jgi:hypothetical protein
MSEFSESFHFASAERDEVARALESGGMKGVVWGPSDTGWVTFVPFDSCPGHVFLTSPATDFAGRLSKLANKQVLVWLYAEDHGWYAMLWRDGTNVATYGSAWDPEINVETTAEAIAEFVKLPVRAGMTAQATESLPTSLDEESLFSEEPHAYRFAEALGLPEYQWKSSQYLTIDMKEGIDHEGLQIGRP